MLRLFRTGFLYSCILLLVVQFTIGLLKLLSRVILSEDANITKVVYMQRSPLKNYQEQIKT